MFKIFVVSLRRFCEIYHGTTRTHNIPSKKAEPFKQWLAKVGAEVARNARADIEHDHITPHDELPFAKENNN